MKHHKFSYSIFSSTLHDNRYLIPTLFRGIWNERHKKLLIDSLANLTLKSWLHLANEFFKTDWKQSMIARFGFTVLKYKRKKNQRLNLISCDLEYFYIPRTAIANLAVKKSRNCLFFEILFTRIFSCIFINCLHITC
jgi:hypothetical protein